MNQEKRESEGKLFSRNFILLVLGQISSLFANTVLRFALSMYILELTGSAFIFAGLLAASMVPAVILSPFGGILADRANRRNIMVALDFLSGITALLTLLSIRQSNAVFVVGAALVFLSALGAFESPTVQAAVPQMQTGDNIIRANAVVNQVAALAALIAPFAGSACYVAFGLKTVLAVSTVGFFLTAVFEIFIRLPFTGEAIQGKWMTVVKSDFKLGFCFVTKQNPQILKMLLAISAVSFFIMGTANVGLPFIVRTVLGLEPEYVGAAESVCGAAAIAGSIIVGVAVKHLKASAMYKFLIAMGVSMIPMGLAFLLDGPVQTYAVILISMAVMQIMASIFSIYVLSMIQMKTPNELLGKVMAYIAVVTLCMQPMGQILYGVLYEVFRAHILWIMIGSALCIILLSVLTRKVYED